MSERMVNLGVLLDVSRASQTWGTLTINATRSTSKQSVDVQFYLENELCDMCTLSASDPDYHFECLLGNSKAEGDVSVTFATEHGGVAETLRGDFEYCLRQYSSDPWQCKSYKGIITQWSV